MAIVSNISRVREVMRPVRVIVGPHHTLAQAAARMIRHSTGSAIVLDHELPGPMIISERDLLRAVAAGLDPALERVESHMTEVVATASPEWPLADAARLMISHGVRHVLAYENGYLVGVLSMRDLLRAGVLAASDVPVGAA